MSPTENDIGVEDIVQHLRSRTIEFFIREEWNQYIQSCSGLISLCRHELSKAQDSSYNDLISNLRHSLCLALSNCAEASFRLRNFSEALNHCEQALEIEPSHFKSLICKGKLLLSLNRYSSALCCFETAVKDPQSGSSKVLCSYLENCKRLQFQARTGLIDISDWIINGFPKQNPELAEYIGAVQVKSSSISGLGLFATKGIDAGTPFLCTKAIAVERAVDNDLDETAKLVMWKNFVYKVQSMLNNCRISHWVSTLSSGDDEDGRVAPDMNLFRPDTDESFFSSQKIKRERLLTILDVNSVVEQVASSNTLGRNGDYYGVGLWVLPSFVNHSCCPNSRRLHVGDHVIVHACRNIREGEEITFSYFDILCPFYNRQKMCENWGFQCGCTRCKFEADIFTRTEMTCFELAVDRGLEPEASVCRLEDIMKRMGLKGMEKGYLRSSFFGVYSDAYSDEKSARKWGRKLPTMEMVIGSMARAVCCDDRLLKLLMKELKKGGYSMSMMDRMLELGRGLYGKVVRKQKALRILLHLGMESC